VDGSNFEQLAAQHWHFAKRKNVDGKAVEDYSERLMHTLTVRLALRNALTWGALCLLALPLAGQEVPGVPGVPGPVRGWEAGPYRNFGSTHALLGGRVILQDELDDPDVTDGVSMELQRLSLELEKEGWRAPSAGPLQVLIGRRYPDATRRVASRGLDKNGLVAASLQLDASGMVKEQIVREIGRLYALATLQAYGVSDSSFLTLAAAAYLEGPADDQEKESASLSASAPDFDLIRQPAAVGRLYVEEFCRQAGGAGAFRAVWEKAAESREDPLGVLRHVFTETTGKPENALLQSFAARLYATSEGETSPSRLNLTDLEAGALDASPPEPLALRHRLFLPSSETTALRMSWPEDGGLAALVVRYRDPQLPPDVVYVAAGQTHTISLSGVSRIDWAVAGSLERGATAAPALIESLSGFPYTGLSAQAVAGPGAPRLTWTTASHESLAGWAVFREEVLADGRITRTGPEIVPASTRAEDSMRYVFVDQEAAAGTFYRYTVWAVTEDGLLARAFAATLRTTE
jgi:hypothetical protein